MSRYCLAFSSALLFLLSQPARCDEASKTAKVEEFMTVANIEQNLKQALDLAMNQMKNSMLGKTSGVDLPPDRAKKMEEMQDKLSQLMRESMSWDKLKADFIKIYSDAYTEQQIDDMLAFYRSPTGRAMIAKMPQLMAQSMAVAQQHVATIMPEIQKLVHDSLAK
jgi:hypothetical protein